MTAIIIRFIKNIIKRIDPRIDCKRDGMKYSISHQCNELTSHSHNTLFSEQIMGF